MNCFLDFDDGLLPLLRNMLPLLPLCWALPAAAVSQVDIHVGKIQTVGAEVQNLSATLGMDGHWQGNGLLKQGDVAVLMQGGAQALKFSKGTIGGKFTFAGEHRVLLEAGIEGEIQDAAFSDAEGMHAGEKLGGHLAFDAMRSDAGWNWSGGIDWKTGEVYWQPLYFADGGLSFRGKGRATEERLVVERGQLDVRNVGTVAVACDWQRKDRHLSSLDAEARNLDAAAVYPLLIKPFMEKTMLGNLEMAGRADFSVSLRDGALSAFDVALRDFDVADKDDRFALYKVNARVPWDLNRPTQASLHYDGGQLLSMPLGQTNLAATLDGYSLTAPVLRLPVMDGELTLRDVSAAFLQNQWHWHLGASLSPVSMAEFSHAVGWPAMQGKVAASIPMVTYSDGRMTTDGALGLDLFDGSIVIRDLSLLNPLGQAPRLQADIQMRNLDLELLTRTYSFGAMTGRLDGDVKGLELARWQPVKFDADFHSSPGSYPRKISQRAVENISSLGGAGAAAAIQRSFLQFFKEFNYAKIGLSCRLRNGTCAMDGVEPTASGYVIVKGSGIPSITVTGYNRSVGWNELLARIKRVTQGGASPVIK